MSLTVMNNDREAVVSNAELFNLIVENNEDLAVLITDSKGIVTNWNSGIENLLGYTEGEINGQSITVIFTPEDIAAEVYLNEREQAELNGKTVNIRWYQRRDGSRFRASVKVMAVKNPDGALRGFAYLLRDETSQKLLEETLQESENLTRSILESSIDCVKVLDLEGHLQSMNAPGLCIMEIDDFTEFAGRRWTDFWTGAEHEKAVAAVNDALLGQTGHFRGYAETAKGTRKYWDVVVSPILDPNGIPKQILSVSRDISTQKGNEVLLDRANERTQTVLESITDSFYRFDRDLRYTYVNPATTTMFSMNEEEFLGRTLDEVFPDIEGNIFHREVQRALQTKETIIFENYYKTFDRWFENRIYPADDGLSIFTSEITDRKRTENLLRISEEKYRTLFDSIDEGFCVVEVLFDNEDKPNNYRFLEINPSFEQLTGIPADQVLLGNPVTELVPNLETKWFEIYGRVAITGEAQRFTEGSEAMDRWFDVYAFRIGEPEQRRVAIIFNNVTDRKKAEITLRAAEERYRALIESTATTVWHASPEGALTFVGEPWTEVTGQSVEEILKWGWVEALHPDDREPTIERWQTSLANKTLYDTEFRILTTIGEYRWFAVNAVPILNADGSIREWVGSNIDITERKRAEEDRAESRYQLEIERSRLAYIFEQAPAFVAVLRDAEHIFELTNPAYLQLIGHRNVIGKTVREGLPEIAGQGFYELLDRVFQTGEPFIGRELPVELQLKPNGALEKRFLDFVYQPIFGVKNQISGIFVHGVDITEQVESRREAEKANNLKDEFLATLSHELRTPLNAIIGWTQILKSRQMEESERQNAINIIDRSARAQNQLIEDILDISRIITGKLRLDVQAVDLLKVISAATDASRPAAEAKAIKMQTLLDPKATVISGDPDRIQQVVWNLLSNAVKFTRKNGRVQVRLERVNSHVEITVSDTGKGIEPEFLPHVFDRFRQSDGSTTRRQGGLGLGLAIVRQIVEMHGGTVAVESGGLGEGAKFTVCFPLLPLRTELVRENPRFHPEALGDEGPIIEPTLNLNNLQILVVDDELDSRELLKFMLDSNGANVTTAGSAAEALSLIDSRKFDLIISDIGMPEEDGFSLIRRIRQLSDERSGKIPAIALTAYARAEDRIQALQSGFQTHIAKPVNHAELIAIIENLTGRMKL